MVRVFIFAIDGLEHDWVVDWELNNLKQSVYGKFDVSEFGDNPLTPSVWASFITGGYMLMDLKRVWTQTNNKHLRGLLDNCPEQVRYKIQWLLQRLGFNPRRIDKTDLGSVTTIFDHAANPFAVDVPAWNPNHKMDKLICYYSSTNPLKLVHLLEKSFKQKSELTLEILKNKTNYDLFVLYLSYLDFLNHIYPKSKILKQNYEYVNRLVSIFKRLHNGLFLVVSDHGSTEDGFHSTHGFWSVNINTSWHPAKIVDFYPKILEWIRL